MTISEMNKKMILTKDIKEYKIEYFYEFENNEFKTVEVFLADSEEKAIQKLKDKYSNVNAGLISYKVLH